MSVTSASENTRKLNEVKNDCWSHGDLNLDIDSVLQRLSHLQAQLEVHKALQKTAKLLVQTPTDKALPNQQATRVKHFIKFVFEKTERWGERQTQLRKLECDALKFCGLSYTIKEIHELPLARFDFLVANISDYVRRHKLSDYLYRDDIDKGVQAKFFNPEEEEALKEFLKKHIELRPSKRARYTQDETSLGIPEAAEGYGQINLEVALTGRLYELTIGDAQAAVMSNRIRGHIWLTDPYEKEASPFITFSISRGLSNQIATRRVQIM